MQQELVADKVDKYYTGCTAIIHFRAYLLSCYVCRKYLKDKDWPRRSRPFALVATGEYYHYKWLAHFLALSMQVHNSTKFVKRIASHVDLIRPQDDTDRCYVLAIETW